MTVETTSGNVPAVRQQAAKAPVALSRPLADIDQAWRMAQALSQSSLLPDPLRGKASDVLVILMYGQELGFSPMQAIQAIYVVKGKPQLSGQAWIAKVREARHRLEISDHTVTSCTVTITRGDTGEQHTETFTMEDARTAKLASSDTYLKYPKRMLLWRAVSNCATVACPEVAMGYGTEVLEGPETAPETALAQAVDARTPEPEPVDITDAEVVDNDAADEEARQQVLEMARQHEQGGAGGWPETAPSGGEQ
jgi:hypothetical protein